MVPKKREVKELRKIEDVNRGKWTEKETVQFYEGCLKFGKKARLIAGEIGTRNLEQVKDKIKSFKIQFKGMKEATTVQSEVFRIL